MIDHKQRFQDAAATIRNAGERISLRYHHDSRQITACMAGEDECDYKFCPRWRDGVLIDDRHCALDYVEDEP